MELSMREQKFGLWEHTQIPSANLQKSSRRLEAWHLGESFAVLYTGHADYAWRNCTIWWDLMCSSTYRMIREKQVAA